MNYWNTVLAMTTVLSVVLYITTHNDNVGASIFSAAMFGFLLSAIITGIVYVEYKLFDSGMQRGQVIGILILAVVVFLIYSAIMAAAILNGIGTMPSLLFGVIVSVVLGYVGTLVLQAIRWGCHKTGITILS